MAQYDPTIFECKSLKQAKEIILTAESGVSTEQRWQEETAWLKQIVMRHFTMNSGLILDFGCGVGRMAKTFTNAGHFVVGVDASAEMRGFANQEEADEHFAAISPTMLARLSTDGLEFDLALSIWVLQHCCDLEGDADKIIKALKPGGGLFIVDMNHRAIPTDQGWINDGKSVFNYISKHLTLVKRYKYDFANAPANLVQNAWIGYFRKE